MLKHLTVSCFISFSCLCVLLKVNPFVRQKLRLVLDMINFVYRVVSLEFQLRALDVVGARYLLLEMNKWISWFFFKIFSFFLFPTAIGKDSKKGLKHRFLSMISFIPLAVRGLHCCCRLLSSCSAWASRCGSFSCSGARAPGTGASVVVASRAQAQ